jgi:hypothetical protein
LNFELENFQRYPGAVRRISWTVLYLVIVGVTCAAAQRGPAGSGDQFLGAWTGSWEGAGSTGGFDLTLERVKDGPLAAKVSVTGEPTYQAALSEVAFDGKKMTGKYDFPPQPQTEIILEAAFDGTAATGTWSLRDKASGTEVISGTWKVNKN